MKNIKWYEKYILWYFEQQKKYNSITARYNEIKFKFYKVMSDFFDVNSISEYSFFPDSLSAESKNEVVVKKVRKSTVSFIPSKIKKMFGDKIYKKVVTKTYTISDMPGLIEYLKKCNVDPKVFRSYLQIKEDVDVKKIEQLCDTGEIDEDKIKKCCVVKLFDPYFMVKTRGDKD